MCELKMVIKGLSFSFRLSVSHTFVQQMAAYPETANPDPGDLVVSGSQLSLSWEAFEKPGQNLQV